MFYNSVSLASVFFYLWQMKPVCHQHGHLCPAPKNTQMLLALVVWQRLLGKGSGDLLDRVLGDCAAGDVDHKR